MRALSLTQPWASLVALGLKEYETRSWRTSYRGPLAIHAAKGYPPDCRRFAEELFERGLLPAILPRGVLLARTEVVDCQPTHIAEVTISKREQEFGDYGPDRFAIKLGEVVRFATPIPCKGALGLWLVPPDIEAQFPVRSA